MRFASVSLPLGLSVPEVLLSFPDVGKLEECMKESSLQNGGEEKAEKEREKQLKYLHGTLMRMGEQEQHCF